ncbi:hypothetical protein KDA_18470 [Dictyobacter alpinus]|uniref:Sensor protein KdpD transmembrane domain-containing protein n=1 Tax=Dictyobacter alpinus TaxID=2014873 RepID=A0A402B4T4_9CHLR|nr:DUF4118 domain-containing protein [Dictyobacter alpinus]GCE26363.1 hypothetical protein KDA_18470 [Dictyobacter alpinus]
MQQIERIPPAHIGLRKNWQYYVYDTLLAIVVSLMITGVIYFSHLYPRISDIIMLQLIWIIVLAIWRSRYAAIVASLVAFLSFNYFLLPPLYSLWLDDPAQWVTLLVFLITAVVTSGLAGSARKREEQERENEHELRILYELIRVYNTTDDFDAQLDIIALSTLRVFSALGVRECVILMPDQDGKIQSMADAPIRVDKFVPNAEELRRASTVFATGNRSIMLDETVPHALVHFIPLKSANRILCVLYLRVVNGVPWLEDQEAMQKALVEESSQAEFFWTFIEQICSLVERSLLREKLISSGS